MHENENNYKDKSRIIKIIGWLFSLAGVGFAVLAPLEIYCFYLFSDGGKFYYEGFGFGSFMFANISAQIIGYYLLALLFLLLGFGHIKIKKWARTLTLAVLYLWLIVGLPLILAAVLILAGTKDLSLTIFIIVLIALLISYAVVPPLLIRFYKKQNVVAAFERTDQNSRWIDTVPIPVLTVGLLMILYVVGLHLLILLNGIFPVFGTFVYGLEGIILLDITIVFLSFSVFGWLRLKKWAWWMTVSIVGFLTLSTTLTLLNTSYSSLLSAMKFPSDELSFLKDIPIRGYQLAVFTGLPLSVTWGMAILSRKFFFIKANELHQ